MKQMPPLLQLLEGRRVRPRKAPRVVGREIELHMAVARTLRVHIAPGWLWSHYPAGEHREAQTAAKLKAMGVQRGWPDIMLLSPQGGALHALELKRIGEDLSEDQEAFQTWAIGHGVPYAVARTTEGALTVLSSWRCLRISIARSPDGAA